ncbi:hypothetical protein [Corynebacterium callunae]|uniref:hypothetical protein n=1 Tax=Corynebacterium callunae TaxID=1721 RepID=UPI0020002A44|nr:hypothetical protein [Corynebacterium callunae]MCK2199672.1 hypothetical protein [Corynebacterium callunae]
MGSMLTPLPRPLFRIDAEQVRRFAAIVDGAGACDLLAQWRAEDGYDPSRGGRPAIVSDRAILIIFLIVATSGHPLHLTQCASLLTDPDTTDKALELLGLPSRDEARALGDAYKITYRRWYDRLWRAFKRVLCRIDPFSDIPHWRRLTKKEYDEIMAKHDEEREKLCWARATEFFNRLIAASMEELSQHYRDNWLGDLAVDGTFIAGSQRGTRKNLRDNDLVSSDPEGGWYVREGDHKGTQVALAKTKTEPRWGYEATIVAGVMTDQGPCDQPHLIHAMSMDRPGHKPAVRALEAIRHLMGNDDVPKGTIVGDRAYFPKARVENYHDPLRRAGYTVVGDYPKNKLGKTHEFESMKLVEGGWYCPAITDSLIHATEDKQAGHIDQETYDDRIEGRRLYAMRRKGTDDTGTSMAFMCPARGSGKTMYCPLAQKSERDDAEKKRLPRVVRAQLPRDRRSCCTHSTSVTIPHNEGMKYRQTGPAYETPAWRKTFGTFRNVIETRNALIKNGRGASIGDHTRRLVRGFAAAWMFTALGVISVNLSLIAQFLLRVAASVTAPPPVTTPPSPPGTSSPVGLPHGPPHDAPGKVAA